MFNKTALRLFALLLCLAATVPQLRAAMYIVGDGPFGGWNPAGGVEMTSMGNNTYSYSASVSGDVYFVFATGRASSSSDWNTFNSNYRMAPTSSNYVVTTDNTYTAHKGYDNAFKLTGDGSSYTFTYYTASNTFIITKQTYEYTFYVRLPNNGTPYLYLWNGSTALNGNWPGTIMTTTEILADTNTWYKLNGTYPYSSLGAIIDLGNGANQSADITNLSPGTYYITWDGGNRTTATVSTNAPTAPVITYDYYVVGNIFPNGWNTGASTLMTDNNDGTYTWTSGEVHLDTGTNYEYKVLDSNGTYHPSGANATFSAAAPGTYTVTVTYDSNTGTVDAILNTVQLDPTYNYTFYVLPDDANVTPTLYLWGTNNNNYRPNDEWPGTAMSDTEVLADDNTWYKYTGALYANLMNAIVNNGGNGHQTSDITNLAPGTYYIRWNVNENSYTIETTAPTAPDYYVVGDEALIGYDWAINENTKMTGSSNSYTWSKSGIHLVAGDYDLKVKDSNGRWYGDSNGNNVTVTADANGTYTLNVTFNKGTGVVSATLTKTATDPTYTYNIYVRYAGNEDVSNVYAYVYDSFGNKPLGDWGGTKLTDMTSTVINGHTYYTTTVTSYDPAAIIILNENQSGSSQTENITLQVGDNYFTYQGGSTYDGPNSTPDAADPTYDYTIYVRYKGNGTPYMYLWDTNGELLTLFPGIALTDNTTFTSEVINGYTYYKYTLTGSRYSSLGMILNEGDGEGDHQTADLSVPSGTHYYTYGGGNIINGPNDQADPAITYYAESSFYGWTTEGTQMTSDGNGGFTKTFSGVNLTGYTTYEYKVYGNDGTNEGVWFGDANGNNKSFAPEITGTYDLTITLDSNGNISHSLTLTQPGTIYITGDGVLGGFSSDQGIAMTAAGNGVYTYTTTLSDKATTRFIFSDGLDADWSVFNNNYRIAPSNGDENYIVNSGYTTTQKARGDNGSYSVTAGAGTLTFYFDAVNMQYKVEGTVPPIIYYVVGNDADLFGAEWTQNNAGRMTYDSQTATYTWTISNVHLTRGGDYRFKVNGDDNSWYPGYGEDNISIAVGQNGTYDLTITFDGQNVDYTLTPIDLDPFYIQGASELGLSWNYAPTTEMTYDASTGYYTYTCTVENAGTYNFVFGFGQGTDWDDYNNNYSVGPNGATDQSIMPNDEWNSTQMAAGSNKAYSITVNPGTVTFTFDPVNMRFKVNGESLTHRYTFYVLPSDHTTAPYIYLWGLGTDESYTNAYPGNQLTQTEQLADGNTWYKLTVDLTAPYIHALVNGGGDGSKTQDITHIDPGTYYIYWSTTREPGDTVNAYILTTVPPSDAGAPFYIHGTYYLDGTQYHYSSSDGTQMKYDANTHTYYLNNVYLASDNTFCFSTELGNDWQSVGTRYGNGGPDYHTGEGTTNYFAVNSDWINKNLSLNIWSETYGEFKMFEPGIYNILANPEQNWVKLIKTDHSTLTPMNVYLEQTPNVVMSEDFVQIPGTEYTTDIFGNGNWPLAAYNGTQGDWNPHDNGNAYHVTYMGDTITADGKSWWHWQVKASIAELFFTRQNKEPYQSDIIRRKAGVLWITWDEVDGQSTLTDHSREYFDAAANALPTNAVVMEGHYYVYFINTVGWENVYCYAWDNNEMVDDQGNPYIDNTFYDGYSRKMNKWPGQPCELVGIDPVTGYEVWRYDFGTIIGTDIPNGGILFNDGNEYGETEDKEQTGDFEFINGAVYDYLGMVDGDFTLNNLIRKGSLDVRYTISNDLLGVYYDADAVTRITYLDERQQEQHEDIIGALYAKDLNLYGEKSIMPDDSYTDYVYDICSSDHTPGRSQIMIKKTTYDQSNWVKLVVSPNYDGRGAVVPQNERPDLSQYVGHIIPAGTLDVFMTDTINPEAHVLSIQKGGEMNYEPNVYISSHFNDTVVFNFTHQDWLGPDAQYKPNYSCQPQITWNYNEEGEVTGGVATRHPDKNHPYYMYYVAPKPQELAYITWVVYDNDNSDEIWPGYTHGEYNAVTGEGRGEEYPVDPGRFYAPMNWNRSIYLDAEAYPSLSQLTEATQIEKALGAWSPEYGPYSNGYMQYGGIKINWSLFDSDACGKPWWQIIKPGQAYKILAIVRYARGSGEDNSANNYCYGPSNGYIDDNILDGSDDSAPGAVHNAPRRVVDNSTGFANMYFTDYDYLDESKFIIFPIMASSEESNGSGLGNVTTVKEVKTTTSREVVAVRYYNLMGVVSNKPFDGINIVVTTYSDGSRSSKKILR